MGFRGSKLYRRVFVMIVRAMFWDCDLSWVSPYWLLYLRWWENMSPNVRKCTFWHVPNENPNQPANPQSLIRVFVVRKTKFYMAKFYNRSLSKMHIKILIKLYKCAGWSESLLSIHVRRYVFYHWVSCICVNYSLFTNFFLVYNQNPHAQLQYWEKQR